MPTLAVNSTSSSLKYIRNVYVKIESLKNDNALMFVSMVVLLCTLLCVDVAGNVLVWGNYNDII